MSSRWISAADCSVTFIVYVTNVVSHSLNSPFIHLSGSPLFSTAVCPSWKGTENCTARREETNSYIPFRIGRWPKFHLPIQCMLDGLLANSLASICCCATEEKLSSTLRSSSHSLFTYCGSLSSGWRRTKRGEKERKRGMLAGGTKAGLSILAARIDCTRLQKVTWMCSIPDDGTGGVNSPLVQGSPKNCGARNGWCCKAELLRLVLKLQLRLSPPVDDDDPTLDLDAIFYLF